jgi:ATP-dependent protease Clp ATPase subunit
MTTVLDRCAWCGTTRDQVQLFAGPQIWICAGCVELAADIVAEVAGDAAERPAARREDDLRCTFCQKAAHEVRVLVAGLEVAICDTCIADCNAILQGNRDPRA